MKLLRYGPRGQEQPGIIDGKNQLRDLSQHVEDITSAILNDESLREVGRVDIESLPVVQQPVRPGPCVKDIGKIICIGLNYSDHATESGMPVPEEPIIFTKTCRVTGANDPIIIPKGSEKTDWEVELGVIIGSRAQYVAEIDALHHVAGYCIVNDVSERAYQLEHGGQWTKGKSCDSFAPIGPWLVTRDELPDPQDLKMWLDVDGRRYQDGNTKTMVYGVANLVSYLSHFMTLYPGDLIATGTPPGVGMGQKPHPVYLQAGNVVSLAIQGLGEQRLECVDWPG